jgi:hypothetical protein
MTPLRIAGADTQFTDSDGPDLIARAQGSWRVSKWEVTPGEAAIIATGGCIELWVDCGNRHPAVRMRAVARLETLFEDEATKALR